MELLSVHLLLLFSICTRSRKLCSVNNEIKFKAFLSSNSSNIFVRISTLAFDKNSSISMSSVTRIGIDAKVLCIDFQTDGSNGGFLVGFD